MPLYAFVLRTAFKKLDKIKEKDRLAKSAQHVTADRHGLALHSADNFHLYIPHTKLRDAIWEYGRFEVYDCIITNSLNVKNATEISNLHVYSGIFPLRHDNRDRPGCGEIRSLLSDYRL